MSIRPGRYLHYKGKEYIVHGIATHTESEEMYVVYNSVAEPDRLWIRPLAMFRSTVVVEGEVIQRFRFLDLK